MNFKSSIYKLILSEYKVFLTAIAFFTRIRVPELYQTTNIPVNSFIRYFPFAGWIVGSVSASVFYFANYIFPIQLSIILSIITGIILTGSLHEDGLADVCDGFGGGYTKQKILDIMKDSRIGTYGVIGIVLMLAAKIAALSSVNPQMIPVVLIAGHSFSRFATVPTMYFYNYARNDGTSKSPVTNKRISVGVLAVALLFGLLPFLLFNQWKIILIIFPVLVVAHFLAKYFHRKIGGYTGDCLGAMQQISEIVFYLSYLGLCKFV